MNTTFFCPPAKKIIGRILVILPLYCLLATNIFSQKINEDSLKKVIRETRQDTTRIIAMRKLASYYILHKGQDSAGLAILKQADEQARKINFQLGICEVLLTEGNYYARKSN